MVFNIYMKSELKYYKTHFCGRCQHDFLKIEVRCWTSRSSLESGVGMRFLISHSSRMFMSGVSVEVRGQGQEGGSLRSSVGIRSRIKS